MISILCFDEGDWTAQKNELPLESRNMVNVHPERMLREYSGISSAKNPTESFV